MVGHKREGAPESPRIKITPTATEDYSEQARRTEKDAVSGSAASPPPPRLYLRNSQVEKSRKSQSSEALMAHRQERMHALEALLELQRNGTGGAPSGRRHEREGEMVVRAVFATWHLRTAAASAAIAERARLRADCLDRVGQAITFQHDVISRMTVLSAFRAWASDLKHEFKRRAELEGSKLLSRFLRSWRQLVTTLSSLRKLTWMEPSTVCGPEFAAASWQAASPRVYRAVLLPSLQLDNAVPEAIGHMAARAKAVHCLPRDAAIESLSAVNPACCH